MEPARLYVIIGDPTESVSEPAYPTDPRHYGLPLFREPVSDEEFEREHRSRVKAFVDRGHAIRFAWGCNMIGVRCPVYERVGGEWVYSESETGRMAEDLSAY